MNEDEDEKFSRSKNVQSPAYTTAVELLRSVSKWEIVGCGADYLPDSEVLAFSRVYTP
jgi:hypothetical protein